MSTTCPYVLLGLPTTASEQDIRHAYRNMLDRVRAGIDGTRSQADHTPLRQLDEARQAYRLLIDNDRRRTYDSQRLAAAPPGRSLHAEARQRPVTGIVAATATRELDVQFEGSGRIYFRIWITNLLLSLLTLGIYSAWAKVRREQYFCRHLRLDGATFDYHANPKAILLGRIVFFLAAGAYSLTRFMPASLAALVTLGAVLLFPWMIVRSLQFRAANTSYRGLRFNFRGRYREALNIYLGYGLLTFLTLGLALPLMLWRQKKFVIEHLGYGANAFGFYATRTMFYKALWLPTLLVFALFGGLFAAFAVFGKSLLLVLTILFVSKLIIPWLILTVLVINFLVIPYTRMRALNVAWSQTRINDVQCVCRQRFPGYAATQLSNGILMLLSFGLFRPWAAVRMLQYRVTHFAIASPGALDGFIAARRKNPAALAGEAAASLDMDVGL